MNQSRAVRELQAALHLRLDGVYAPTAPRIRAVILRHAVDGVLTPTSARLAWAEVGRILAAADARAALLISRGIGAAAVLGQTGGTDIEAAWRAANPSSFLMATRRGVSDRRARAMRQVSRVLDDAAKTGRPVKDVATHLGQYASPQYATRRDPRGTIRRGNLPRVSGPALPGRAGVPSRHLMTSEIIITHGEATVERAVRTPGGLVRWDLAPWHSESDACEELAERDNGWGPGLYDPRAVPDRPHFGCVCLLIFQQEP